MSALIPVDFGQANTHFTGGHGVDPLPAFRGEGMVISCWKMGLANRIRSLFFGKVWLAIQGDSQPPVWLDVDKTIFDRDKP